METFWLDFRFGIRMLAKNPGFTAVAVLSLALGIGANSAIFSVVNATLLRLRPYPKNADSVFLLLVMDFTKASFGSPGSLTNYLYWRDQNQVFEQLAAYRVGSFNLTSTEKPEQLEGLYVSANLFSAVGAQAVLGRTFQSEENQPGTEHVVVISDGLWKHRFGADPSLVGKMLRLNGEAFMVLGILPPNFASSFLGQNPEVWVPLTFGGKSLSEMVVMVARLKPNMTLEQARSNMNLITRSLIERYPDDASAAALDSLAEDADRTPQVAYRSDGKIPRSVLKNGWIVDFFPLNRPVDSSSVSALFLLQGAVTFVLLIACANVANLLLARGAARQREIATRVALGAGRFRLVRQFFTEGLLLAMLGGGLGLLLAVWGLNFFVRFLPRGIPVLFYVYEGIALDIRVLGFTVMSAFLAAIVFGLAPALRASKPDLQEMLKEGARGSTESLGLRRGRSLLVVMGIATALVLLIGAGLMVKSFLQLNGPFADLEPQNVLSMSITLDANKYRSWHRVRSFWGELQQRIAVLGQSMGFNANQRTNKPWLSWVGVAVEGGAPLNSAVRGAQCDVITPDYLKTMRIPLLRGRYFSEDDARGALPVAIINERFARHFFPTNRDPVGKQIRIINVAEEDEEIDKTTIANAKDIGYFIVGVVRDLRRTGETEGDTPPIMYIPYSLTPEAFTAAMRRITIRLRTQSAPLSLAGAVRNAVSRIDADQPVSPPITLEQADSRFLAPERFLTLLFGTFAFVAMGLASVGIYGVMAYLVTRRTHEIAIRMALGARRGDVLWLVLRHGLKLTLAGIALGLVGAFSLKRILSSYIFGVSSTDPVTFAIVSVVLISVALLATYVPARKATKVDPMAALRSE